MDSSASRFWDKYICKTKTYGIKLGVARWYVKHVEDYIKYHTNLKLSDQKPEQIEQYPFAKTDKLIRFTLPPIYIKDTKKRFSSFFVFLCFSTLVYGIIDLVRPATQATLLTFASAAKGHSLPFLVS